MPFNKLPNYLRTYRRRAALSQDEVAFLLGVQSGAKVCRYERFSRTPSLETALAFQVVFCASTRNLFGGLYQKIERDVGKRAAMLARRLTHSKQDGPMARKLDALRAITEVENP